MRSDFYFDSRKAWSLVLICPLFALIGLFFAVSKADTTVGVIVGSIFLLTGCLGFAVSVQRLGDRGVVLKIDQNGILDRRLAMRPIQWHQIAAIHARETLDGHPFRYMDLAVNKTTTIDTGLTILLWRIAGSRGLPISDDGLDGSFNEILVAVNYYADGRRIPVRL